MTIATFSTTIVISIIRGGLRRVTFHLLQNVLKTENQLKYCVVASKSIEIYNLWSELGLQWAVDRSVASL